MAFDRKTGEMKYCEPRLEHDNYCEAHTSPAPAVIGGRPILLITTAWSIEGIDPETGKVAWFADQYSDRGNNALSSLAVGGRMVYGDGVTGYALAFDPLAGARGEITKDVTWKKAFPSSVNDSTGRPSSGLCASPIIAGGYLYRGDPYDKPYSLSLRCLDVATGKELYLENLGPNKNYTSYPFSQYASPFATADGYVYFASAGKSVVVKGGPKFELVAVNNLGDANFTGYDKIAYGGGDYNYSSAAVSGGRIFIQGHNKLWCIGNR
jgi:outer membrane protein assembly factor BamB